MFAFLLLKFLPGIEPFLTALEKFIVAHWKEIVICLMIGTIGYQNFSDHRFVLWIDTIPYLKDQLTKDEAQIKKLTDDLDVAAKANAALATTIQNDNSTVDQWKNISDQLQKKNDALTNQLTQERVASDKKVSDILNQATPTSCEASIDYLRQQGSKLTW